MSVQVPSPAFEYSISDHLFTFSRQLVRLSGAWWNSLQSSAPPQRGRDANTVGRPTISERRSPMENQDKATKTRASRRSFIRKGLVAAGLATVGTELLGSSVSLLAQQSGTGGGI